MFLHERLGTYIQRLRRHAVAYLDRPAVRSPSELVEHAISGRRAPSSAGTARGWALLVRRTEVPEDIQIWRHILRHRIGLGPHAASHG